MPKRILMIDDSIPLHQIVRCQLADLDVEIHSATDGATGLAAAARLRPSVILLDVDLPDLDGFDVCRRLKAGADTASIPVIFLTADGTGPDRQRGLDLGAVDYVTKPFKPDELRGRILASIRSRWQAELRAGIDEVTGLSTRAQAEECLPGLAAGTPLLSCVVADVDGIRLINGRHGFVAGDAVLRSVGGVFRNNCPPGALCWAGGGQFGALLPDLDRRAASRLANRIRDGVRDRVAPGPEGGITASCIAASCSFGVADTRVATAATLVGRAEVALARAKQNGSARICVARAGRRAAAA